MKPDWDKLMAAHKDNANVLVADVDCTAGGKSLCDSVGVRGYPTIKHGDPNDLQDYKGGRDLAALEKFTATLGPVCGPTNIDLCDDEKKKQIEEMRQMTPEAREAEIKAKNDEVEKAESDFKKFVEGLQASYEKSNKDKEAKIEEIKNSGFGLLKAVHAAAKKAAKDGKAEL